MAGASRARPRRSVCHQIARGPVSEAALHLGVGLQDDLAATAVHDHGHPGADVLDEPCTPATRGRPSARATKAACEVLAAALGEEAAHARAAQLCHVGGREIVGKPPRPWHALMPGGVMPINCARCARRSCRCRCAARGIGIFDAREPAWIWSSARRKAHSADT